MAKSKSMLPSVKASPLPARPETPIRTLQVGMGKVMTTLNKPMDAINMGIATATAGISKALPSFPAATLGSLAIGCPHVHVPPTPPFFPLPPIGPTLFGCCISVLIGGLPAARCGDIGLSPTCLGGLTGYEIFTGSSKVFIGGARAARLLDVTMHCWPPKAWYARGAIAALVKAATVAQKVMGKAGEAMQVVGIAADAGDAVLSAVEGDRALASAYALSAGMGAAQMAADAVAAAASALIGKQPGTPPIGALVHGNPKVLIGGFPMPSGMQLASRKLASASRKKPDKGENDVGPSACSR